MSGVGNAPLDEAVGFDGQAQHVGHILLLEAFQHTDAAYLFANVQGQSWEGLNLVERAKIAPSRHK